ncbi:hypothetical protein ASJ33_05450 [Dehalococcoides mccartyi]|jgi:hypothetical protein|uniref:recombination directionality factor n=1 Tax=Dehalococcoides mccartyi TaxID=61435 RepID=UPI0004E0A865|nr:hypothetical protein [Dehalococcoides mccartyi]AII58080.1 hypothetical protein X792_04880 [Dehalococcoides mccartyi CG1]APH12634.1 hypothetical protein ASJ33_05450 [Dehalococcoides mccartyi]
MPIKGLSETRRMPRLGKIHLGIKAKNANGVEYPKAVDYFVCPPEVQAVFGEKPKELAIMFPLEDEAKFASQYYRCYSNLRGLVCKGDGEISTRLIDTATGDFAGRDSKETVMKDLPCTGRDCSQYQAKKCKEVMNLLFLLPSVPGLGIWQLDTGSINSIITLNSAIELVRGVCGRVSMIPLTLAIEPREVTAEGKKKTINALTIKVGVTLAEIQKYAALPVGKVLLPPPDDEKPDMLYPEVEGIEEEEPEQEKVKEPAGNEAQLAHIRELYAKLNFKKSGWTAYLANAKLPSDISLMTKEQLDWVEKDLTERVSLQ